MRRSTKALVCAMTLAIAGCGIPDQTDVRVVKAGPPTGRATDSAAGLAPPQREDAGTKEAFVANFLAAAAGESDKAYERVRKYLARKDALKEQPSVQRHVVRVIKTTFIESGPGAWTVTLAVQQVGVLGENGTLDAPVLRETSYDFTVGGGEGGPGWFVSGQIPPLLLSSDALGTYYETRTIYFWSSDRKVLVPDPRYMLKAMPQEAEPTEIVEWLTVGPSSWLSGAVRRLPTNTERTENVPTGDRLEVSLSADAAAPQSEAAATEPVDGTALLGQQLMWSLRPYLRTELVLNIEGQQERTFTVDDQSFLDANPAQRLVETPERFAILDGRIHRLVSSPNNGADLLPAMLADAAGVAAAALARDGDLIAAALVTRQGEQVRLRVGSATGGGKGTFQDGNKVYGQMGRPVWLRAPLDGGLIVADGALYRFGPDSAALTAVDLPDAVAGTIQAVGAAPDGRRIAVVAGGRLYLVTLTRGDDGIQAEDARLVPTPLGQLTGVDWTSETDLVIAGTDAERQIMVLRTSLDGAMPEPNPEETSSTPVSNLTAYPESPLGSSAAAKVMYTAGTTSYDLKGGDSRLESNEVVGAPAGTEASAVTAPFFMSD